MRGKKTLELAGKTVEVYELTFKEIKSLFDMEDVNLTTLDALLSHFGGKILPLVTDLSAEKIIELTPSEAKTLWDAAKEVNAVFFDIVAETGACEYLSRYKNAILQDCLNYAVTSLNEAIVKSGSPDTPISSEP